MLGSLPHVRAHTTSLDLPRHPHTKRPGIYVFKKDLLCDLLDSDNKLTENNKFLDFGGEIIPYAATHGLRVQVCGGCVCWWGTQCVR